MTTLELCLNISRQATSAGEHVVIYNASVELTQYPGEIQIIKVGFFDEEIPDDNTVNTTLESIKTGMKSVLELRGLGARVNIHGLVIHPIDWRPAYFERYTQRALEQALQADTL
jgi:hypothetical protein